MYSNDTRDLQGDGVDTTVVKSATTWTELDLGYTNAIIFRKDLTSELDYKIPTDNNTLGNGELIIDGVSLPQIIATGSFTMDSLYFAYISSSNSIRLSILKSDLSTVNSAGLEAYLQANDVEFLYEYADGSEVAQTVDVQGGLWVGKNHTYSVYGGGVVNYFKAEVPIDSDGQQTLIIQKQLELQDEVNTALARTRPAEEDLRFPATLIRQGVTTKPDFDTTDIVLLFPQNDATEIAYINAQMPHGWRAGSIIEPHVHYIQEADQQPVFKIDYRWHNIGSTVPATWTTYTMGTNIMPYSSGSIHQLLDGGDGIDGTGFTESSILQIKLYRDDNVYTGDVKLIEFDIHYIVEKFGRDV